jgi:hypothetical protein
VYFAPGDIAFNRLGQFKIWYGGGLGNGWAKTFTNF